MYAGKFARASVPYDSIRVQCRVVRMVIALKDVGTPWLRAAISAGASATTADLGCWSTSVPTELQRT